MIKYFLICIFQQIKPAYSETSIGENMKLKIGDEAPDFILSDKNGIRHRLSDLRGKWIVLYFYPKDDTPGCTKEACSFRDNYSDFKKNDVNIIGLSSDSEGNHRKFKDKYNLPFLLLADTEKKVIELYDAVIDLKNRRMSYLIDPQGRIAKIYDTVLPEKHSDEILKDLEILITKTT